MPKVHSLRVPINVEEEDLRRLAYDAQNFYREYPQRKWTEKEYKEAARLCVIQIIVDYVNQRRAQFESQAVSGQGATDANNHVPDVSNQSEGSGSGSAEAVSP